MSIPNPEEKNETVPFYPDHVRIEFYVVLGILALVLVQVAAHHVVQPRVFDWRLVTIQFRELPRLANLRIFAADTLAGLRRIPTG